MKRERGRPPTTGTARETRMIKFTLEKDVVERLAQAATAEAIDFHEYLKRALRLEARRQDQRAAG